jgi:hypothetical protein
MESCLLRKLRFSLFLIGHGLSTCNGPTDHFTLPLTLPFRAFGRWHKFPYQQGYGWFIACYRETRHFIQSAYVLSICLSRVTNHLLNIDTTTISANIKSIEASNQHWSSELSQKCRTAHIQMINCRVQCFETPSFAHI